jgi:hypothetical protein
LKKRTRRLASLCAVAAGILAVTVTGSANPIDGPALSDVSTPDSKAVGYAPASKLSVELSQIAQAQGSTQLENPNARTGFYGYQNDVGSTDDRRRHGQEAEQLRLSLRAGDPR